VPSPAADARADAHQPTAPAGAAATASAGAAATAPAPGDVRSKRRRLRRLAILTAILMVLPVPWRHHLGDDPVAMAWQLDGNLMVAGETLDPAGRWSWLTVGRPPLVAELLYDLVTTGSTLSEDLTDVPISYQPGLVEPTAAAVALRAAGHELHIGLRVEVATPIADGLPEQAVVVAVDDVALTNRAAWDTVRATSTGPISFELDDGQRIVHDGPALPYEIVRVLDVPPEGLSAMLFGWLPDVRPVRWARGLALGPSHGLMVALVTYADATGGELGAALHVAGTGGLRGDGTVVPIGGLAAKAKAAKRAGADVLLYPAPQARELVGFDAGDMRLIPVATFTDAVEALEHAFELRPGLPPERGDEQPREAPADDASADVTQSDDPTADTDPTVPDRTAPTDPSEIADVEAADPPAGAAADRTGVVSGVDGS
jgi:hypothetical protein